MRVAFASSNGKFIDRNFGNAERFDVWEVSLGHAAPIERVVPGPDCKHKDTRLGTRARALDGCALVYATEIGNPATAKLAARNIHALRTSHKVSIADAILTLQEILIGTPPPWLRRAAGLEPVRTLLDSDVMQPKQT